MKIGSIKETRKILEEKDFHIKKKFGQNFIIDQNILQKIVSESGIDDKTGVIEVGPGLGSLTEHIAQKAKKVLCYEIDTDLIPILNETLSDFSNITVLNQDVLTSDVDRDIDTYLDECEKIYVVANLPYYITTTILMHFLEETQKIDVINVMVQKEVGDRLCSNNSRKDYNALSVMVQYRTYARKLMNIPKTIFIPEPNVDSEVISLRIREREVKPKSFGFFSEFVHASFTQRRKTFVNNISLRYGKTKEEIASVLSNNGYRSDARAEMFSVEDFIRLSDIFMAYLETKEEWDLYDEMGNLTGKTVIRGGGIPEGYYHLVVFICLKNSKEEYLIQRRSLEKIGYPGMWTITGGSVTKGENSLQGAKREIFEEMGVVLSDSDLTFISREKRVDGFCYMDKYLAQKDDPIVNIDHHEVIDYKWANLEEIKKMVRNGTFIDRDYERVIKEMVK